MTLFEKQLGRKMKPSDKQYEIMWYLSKVLTKQELIERENWIDKHGKKKQQLTLEL